MALEYAVAFHSTRALVWKTLHRIMSSSGQSRSVAGELFRKYAKELRIYHVSFDFLHVSIFHRPSGDLDCGLTMVHWLVYWFTTSQQRGEPDLSKTSSAVPNCSCPGLVAASFDCISPASGLPHRSLVLNSEAQGRRTFIVRPHRMTAHGILLVYCRSP